MKISYTFLWRCTIAILWLLSVQAIMRAGFQPVGPLPLSGQSYPWVEVVLTSIVTAVECALLYFLLRPQRFAWSLARLGFAAAVFFVLSIGAAYTLLIYDMPAYIYVPSGFTILLTLLLLLLLIIATSISFVKRLSKKDQEV